MYICVLRGFKLDSNVEFREEAIYELCSHQTELETTTVNEFIDMLVPFNYSHVKSPLCLYSVTRVSKKFFSFFKSTISLIHGNGFSTL